MVTHISAQTIRRQAIFWMIALSVFILFLVVFSSVLLPFIVGMALAYFLDPVADKLETWGFSRLWATASILAVFVLLFLLSLMVIIPVLVTQASEFIERLPAYAVSLQELITSESGLLPEWISSQAVTIKENLSSALAQGAGFLSKLFQQIWNSGKALVDIASLFVITPVVAFYLLLDWDDMMEKVDSWIPRDHVTTVRELAGKMDYAIAGFVRGQGSLCIILGIFYAVALSLADLNFGLLIGLFAGLISFIPYVGSIVGLVLSVGVALVQFWPDYIMVLVVAAIFFAGQFLEGNILQPKLVGERVGLHPVWLMFALLAFAALFGFVGMLIAVPAAAAVGVLVRFALERYLDSDLYKGDQADKEIQEADSDAESSAS
ncbi:AI-2E family transporter [Lentilitoribacter sp. Alg239-R112]|uniref:AI-2E family transporter n=2 Tax=unclassified Lentilitoribacter TaxID=2647570 RepID=UPI0013A6B23E|nr:AI-2E family transporter [Lentilitoribacter sp. Alg239-R112]